MVKKSSEMPIKLHKFAKSEKKWYNRSWSREKIDQKKESVYYFNK